MGTEEPPAKVAHERVAEREEKRVGSGRDHRGQHPMYFAVACCTGRKLILGGVLVCTVCDGPVLQQDIEKASHIIRVPAGVETITVRPNSEGPPVME